MATSDKSPVDRRGFLKGAAASAAMATQVPLAAQVRTAAPVAAKPAEPAPETAATSRVEVLTNERPGSDFMLDVIKSLGIEYATANPASSCRALHESIINYGGNKNPELLTCCHEESSVGMAHGYAKIEGKPIISMVHGTVGTQHASMAIYNAF
jgi:benzoylformate decarboxylase/acetolactate synthase-1/2/3 large subunit